MRAALVLLIFVALVAGTTICGPSGAFAAGGAAVEQTADRCDDRPQTAAAPTASPETLAVAPASVEARLALASALGPLPGARAPRLAPARATPLRL